MKGVVQQWLRLKKQRSSAFLWTCTLEPIACTQEALFVRNVLAQQRVGKFLQSRIVV